VLITVEFRLSELIGTASYPDMQKIRVIGFFFENRLHWQIYGMYLYVLVFKPFDHACFEVLEATTLCCTSSITR